MEEKEDFIDDDTDSFYEEAKQAVISLGIPEDEAENFLEDIGL